MAFNLESIATTGQKVLPPRLVVYGTHGIGKTTFASQTKKPIFIPTEDGLIGVSVDAFPIAKSWGDITSALDVIKDSRDKYKTIVIDSADWLENLIWRQTCIDNDKDSIEAFGFGKGYVLALSYWRALLATLDKYREVYGMTVIILAHSDIKRYDNPEAESYDRYTIKLHKSSSALIQEWADIVGFANWHTVIKQTEAGFGKTRARGIATGKRLLHLEERPSHHAKSRYPNTPAEIPLNWTSLVEVLTSSINSKK